MGSGRMRLVWALHATRHLVDHVDMNIFTKQSGQGLALDDYLARPVQLTAAAAKFVKQIMREQRFGPTAYLRVGAKPQEPGVWHELDVMDAPVNPASDYVS